MADFDLFHVKLGGITDDGLLHGTVTVGFWDNDRSDRDNVEIPVHFEANLDASLRELREQAKAVALKLLQKAARLLEEHSTDELHQAALVQVAKWNAEQDARLQESIARSFSSKEG